MHARYPAPGGSVQARHLPAPSLDSTLPAWHLPRRGLRRGWNDTLGTHHPGYTALGTPPGYTTWVHRSWYTTCPLMGYPGPYYPALYYPGLPGPVLPCPVYYLGYPGPYYPAWCTAWATRARSTLPWVDPPTLPSLPCPGYTFLPCPYYPALVYPGYPGPYYPALLYPGYPARDYPALLPRLPCPGLPCPTTRRAPGQPMADLLEQWTPHTRLGRKFL